MNQTYKRLLFLQSICIISSLIFENVILDRIIVLLIFIFCIVKGMNEKNYVNPYLCFSLAPFSLFISTNITDVYFLDLTHQTWFLAIINMIAFLNGLIFYKEKQNISLKKETINISRLTKLSIISYLVSLLGSVINPIASILWLFTPLSIAFAMKTQKKMMHAFVAFIIISSLLTDEVSKMSVLFNCITIVICYEKFYAKSKKEKKRVLIALTASVIFMIFAFTFANKERGQYDSSEGLSYYQNNSGAEWSYSANLFLPYMYFTTPWTNLQYVTESQNNRTFGLWLIKPFIGYFGFDDNYKSKYMLYPHSSFNTFTFISCHFKDFGYWGSVLISFLLGLFVKVVYGRYIRSDNPYDIASYAVVALAVTEMFFSNHFFQQSYPFTAFLMFVILRLFFKGTLTQTRQRLLPEGDSDKT